MTMIDVFDRETCGQPYAPPGLSREYPYACALDAGHEAGHLHIGATVAWPRQPEPPSDDFTDEWSSLAPVQECLS